MPTMQTCSTVHVNHHHNTRKEHTMRYWVYFVGTSNGEWVTAATMKSAKWIFALKHGLHALTYIRASKHAR